MLISLTHINLFDYGYIDSFGSIELYSHLEDLPRFDHRGDTLALSIENCR